MSVKVLVFSCSKNTKNGCCFFSSYHRRGTCVFSQSSCFHSRPASVKILRFSSTQSVCIIDQLTSLCFGFHPVTFKKRVFSFNQRQGASILVQSAFSCSSLVLFASRCLLYRWIIITVLVFLSNQRRGACILIQLMQDAWILVHLVFSASFWLKYSLYISL